MLVEILFWAKTSKNGFQVFLTIEKVGIKMWLKKKHLDRGAYVRDLNLFQNFQFNNLVNLSFVYFNVLGQTKAVSGTSVLRIPVIPFSTLIML